MSRTRFHWFLPTGGDGRDLASGVHGIGIGGAAGAATRAAAPRPASLAYLTQLAQAADSLGYEAVLTPTGAHCADAWIVTSALIAATRRLKFMVAFRPGLVEPALAAHMAATFQYLSEGRLLLNVVTGSSSAEQRGYGDRADHDARYARAEEFLQVVRQAWTGRNSTTTAASTTSRAPGCSSPPTRPGGVPGWFLRCRSGRGLPAGGLLPDLGRAARSWTSTRRSTRAACCTSA